jgi:membrane associated rhomboid family serine protease
MEKKYFFCLWLSLICVIVFVLQNIIPGFTEMFYLTNNSLASPWTFLTAVFLHGSIAHLFYNLFALILFGIMLESIIGSKRFLWLFLVSGFLANLASFWFYPSSLGASGAIMAIIGCLAVLRPLMTIWAFSLPMPMFVAAIIWIGGSVMGIFGFGDQSTGYLAHLGGIAVGLVYGFYLRLRYPQKKNLEQKIVLDENSIRSWEDWNLR